jgi:hypothetical protein
VTRGDKLQLRITSGDKPVRTNGIGISGHGLAGKPLGLPWSNLVILSIKE